MTLDQPPLAIDLLIESTGGGSVRHVMDLFEQLYSRGHDVRLIASLTRSEPQFRDWVARLPESRFIRLDLQRGPHPTDITATWRLRSELQDNTSHRILHAHSSKAGMIAQLVRSKYKATLFTPHAFRGMDVTLSPSKTRVVRVVDHILGRSHDQIIAVSPDELKYARSIGLPKNRLHFVPNGVDAAKIARTAGSALKPTRNQINVGFVGRMVNQKNPLSFIRAFARARAQRSDLHAFVVGAGPLEDEMKAFATANDLSGVVTFVGHASFVENLNQMDVMVHTSKYESLPYVILEACAVGLPIVAVRNAGTETIFGSEADLVDDCYDDAALAASLLETVATPETLKHAARRSRAAGDRFSLETMVDSIETLYRGEIGEAALRQAV